MSSSSLFSPKIFSTLKEYSWKLFWGDLSAGVIVGIVALPLAIAFAIASGVTPERGLTTAIVAGFLISALGGSRVQIGGPTGAFVVIVYHIVEGYGVDGLVLCTFIAGFMLLLMGLLRLGTIIRFIPYPLTVGFTAGIAVIIFSSQVKDFFGLQMGTVPADFFEKWSVYFHHIQTLNPMTLILSLVSLALILLWPKISPASLQKIPGSIVAILIVTAIAHIFHLPVETIESRFGGIPSSLPHFMWPHFSLSDVRQLIGPAFTVALLGSIESLLSATVADGMIEGRHRSNTELIGQGIANLVSPLFGGIPATGAIARTATNIKNGGRTPIAGIVHSLTLLLIVLLFGRWAKWIPLCTLSAVLVIVSYHMSEWRSFKNLLRAPYMDVVVLVATFLLTVFVDLTVAVEIGLVLSLILFMKRMTDVSTIREVTQELETPLDEKTLRAEADSTSRKKIPKEVEVYEAEGALFFGFASTLRDTLHFSEQSPRVVILRMRHVLVLDASGLRALSELKKSYHKMGTLLILSGIHAQPLIALERAGLLKEFGEENVLGTLDEALVRAHQILL